MVTSRRRPVRRRYSLAVKKRVEMGVFGLAARVRAKVRELDGLPRQPKLARRNELENVKGELADMREELTAARSENPFAYWRESPREVARILTVRGNKWRPWTIEQILDPEFLPL